MALLRTERVPLSLDSVPEEHLMSFLQLAHELRSPLATILHCLDVVLQGYTAHDTRLHDELLSRARDRADSMLAQVNDFLRLGAVRHEELSRKIQPVQVLDVLEKLIPEMRVRARWRAVNLQFDLPESLPLVRATPEDIEHLLANLTNNAIKYTEPGGDVIVSLQGQESGIIGVVRDTGIGIAPEDLPHVFKEFYRAENAKSMDAQGTGLGLAISQRVVERAGGWLHAESELGKGSTFSFFLPRAWS